MNENIENVDESGAEQAPVTFTQYDFQPKLFEISKKDTVFAVILAAVSVIFSVLGIWGGFKGGFTIALILLLASVTAYLLPAKGKIKPFPFLCMLLSVGVSIPFTFTSSGAVRFWSLVSVGILDLVWFVSIADDSAEKGDLGIFKNIFSPVFEGAIPNLPVSLRSLFSGREKGNKNFGKAILGIVLSLPVLIVVVPLLMSSDEAFSGMIEMLFGNLILTLVKLGLGLIISVFVISYCFTLKKEEPKEDLNNTFKGIENTVLVSFLSVISLCYLAYLFSQLAYFFSAFSGFLPENYKFTVSAYARRGFFEMTVIAAINFGLIFLSLLISRKKEGKSCISLRIICTFTGIFTLIIIATALSKMFLYISSFGMTRLRIQTSAFMVFLAVVFISLIIRLYLPKVRVIRTAFVTSAVVLIALGVGNVNSIVADYNYKAYKNGTLESVDIDAIYDLGHEGVPYLIKLAQDENSLVSDESHEYLYGILADGEYDIKVTTDSDGYSVTYKKNRNMGLADFSIPEYRANKALTEYVKKNSDFIGEQWERKEQSDYDRVYPY